MKKLHHSFTRAITLKYCTANAPDANFRSFFRLFKGGLYVARTMAS